MGSFDTSAIAEKARGDLLSLLGSVPGKKNLVLQRSLVGPIELLVSFAILKDHGIDRIFFLENDNVDASQRNIVFLLRGDKPDEVQALANQIKRLRSESSSEHELTALWVPRKTLLSDTILEEAGVLGDITSNELALSFLPLDNDVLSLELNECFSDLYLRKDPSSIFASAQALTSLQQRLGLFPKLLAKGDYAARLVDLVLRMRSEHSAREGSQQKAVPAKADMPSSEVDGIVVIDRQSDFSSALLTQLTYEGLIDEAFKIEHAQTELSTTITGMPAQSSVPKDPTANLSSQPAKRKVKLDGSDKLYASLRDANFAIVGGILNKVARRLQNDYEDQRGPNKTTAELRDFVGKLPGYQAEHQSLKIHTNLAEELLKYTRTETFRKVLEVQQNLAAGVESPGIHDIVEDLIAKDCPLTTVLRLLCLESTMNGGLRQKDYEHFRRAIVQAYGYQNLLTLDALDKMGLMQVRSSSGFSIPGTGTAAASGPVTQTNYSAVRKPLQLIMDEVSEQDPTDIAYVYSGYAPLSIRIVQCILQKQYVTALARTGAAPTPAHAANGASNPAQGWRGFENVLNSVKGKTVDETQTSASRASKAKQVLEGRGGKRTTVVFFLGGVTFAEIAALRFLAAQEHERRDLLICTTSIISGDKMVQAAVNASKPPQG